jgi:hypothetical protein
MENVDQLAFCIAHQIAHFLNGDNIIQERYNLSESLTPEEETYLDYIQGREELADQKAFEIYDAAGYSPAQALRYFDVIERNWIVASDLPFGVSFFEDSIARYPEHYHGIDSLRPAHNMPDPFSGTLDHKPSERKRKLMKYYKIDESFAQETEVNNMFTAVNRLATYNCGLISLEYNMIPAALYIGYYLCETDSQSPEEGRLLIAKALFKYTSINVSESPSVEMITKEDLSREEKFYNLFGFYNKPDDPDDTRGYSNSAKEFLLLLNETELATLNAYWQLNFYYQTSSHRKIAEFLTLNSIDIFAFYMNVEPDSIGEMPVTNLIYNKTKATTSKELKMPDELDLKKLDIKKLDLLKPKVQEVTDHSGDVTKVTKYIDRHLHAYVHDSLLQTRIRASAENNAFRRKTEPGDITCDSMYLMNVDHIHLQEYKRTETFRIDRPKTEQKTKLLQQQITANAKYNGVKLFSSPDNTKVNTLESYNNYCLAKHAFIEMTYSHDHFYSRPVAYLEEVDSMMLKTKIKHCVTDFAITRQFRKVRNPGFYIPCLIFPYTAPIAIIYVIPPRKFTFRQTMIFNLETGNAERMWIKTSKSTGGPNSAVMHHNTVFRYLVKKNRKKVSTPQR